MFRFEQLDIWKKAVIYCTKCYKVSERMPKREKYSLADQLRRAAVSISNNIAEGSGSETKKGFKAYLNTSVRSALETVNILYLAKIMTYISEKERKELYSEAEVLIKQIRAFKNSL